jgi:hypothetical protein
MVSRDLWRTCPGSEGSSNHELEVDKCFERLRRRVKARFQLLVVRTAYSPRGADQPGVLPSPRRVASSSLSSSRKLRISLPSSSRAGASATQYSAYFSAAIRWNSGSVCAEELKLCPSLIRDAESRSSGISSVAIVSRILQSDEPPSYWCCCHERNALSNRTDEIEIDNNAPCYSLCLEGSRCVEELELCDIRVSMRSGARVYACLWTSNDMCGPRRGMEYIRLRVVLLPLSLCPRRRILTSGLVFLSSARSVRSWSSIASLTCLANCSARMRASR